MTTGLSISGHSKRYYKNGQIQLHNKSNICGNQDYIGRNIHHVLPKLDEIKYNMANMKENIILGICKTFVNKENCMNNSKELRFYPVICLQISSIS
jgi:hypothetical protein